LQIIANDFAVLPPHMGALHQQQQQQRSRMLGLMQSTAAPNLAQQFVPPAAPRMPFHSSSNTNTARGLFPNPTESSAPNTDAVYYPRPPVLFFCGFLLSSILAAMFSCFTLLVLWSGCY